MPTLLARDDENLAIPALALRPGGSQKIEFTSSSAANAVAFNSATKVISIVATEDVFIKTGDASVTATTSDHFLPAGTYEYISIRGFKRAQHTHIAAIRASADGVLYISERE
jgi:hypothetical protein